MRLVALFVLLAHTCSNAFPVHQDYQVPAPEVDVEVHEVPCNVTEEALADLFRENLDPDLDRWRGQELSMARLEQGLKTFSTEWNRDTLKLVLMYRNQLYLPLEPDPRVCSAPCNGLMLDAMNAFGPWNQSIQFPNALFLFSVHDIPRCKDMGLDCPAPVLSFAKLLHHKDAIKYPTSPDILVPKLPLKTSTHAASFPWGRKSDKAVWRGSRWCDWNLLQYHVNCSRYFMGQLLEARPELAQLIDFGYSGGVDNPPTHPFMPMRDFSRFKFILNLDGYTAAYRLSQLLLMNSIVLKEDSCRGEWYYRSLKPYEHYLPIFKDNATDIVDVIRQWQRPEHESRLRAIIAAANSLSARCCCPRARMLYWRRALQEYRTLIPDMDAAIEGTSTSN